MQFRRQIWLPQVFFVHYAKHKNILYAYYRTVSRLWIAFWNTICRWRHR